MIMLYALAPPLLILPLTAIAISSKAGVAGLPANTGQHGFTAILFAYTSCFANNGQAFASLNANTRSITVTTALAMMAGRFALAIPALGLAALFARQKDTPPSVGTVPTDSVWFALLLLATLLIMTALSYLPALALGPVLERLEFGI